MRTKNGICWSLLFLASGLLCVPEYPKVVVRATKDDPFKINILAYNIKLLDAPGKAGAPGRGTRAKLIPEHVKEYDVVVFLEAFDQDARINLLEGMKQQGFRFSTGILGSGIHKKTLIKQKPGYSYSQPAIIQFDNPSSFKGTAKYGFIGSTPLKKDGGVIIVSKYPIVETKELIYTAPPKGTVKMDVNWDWFANKGVLYAKIAKDGRFYHVFGTHTQAQYSKVSNKMKKELHKTGINQVKEMAQFIKSRDIPNTDLVVAAGDFNINEFKALQKDLFDAMRKELNVLVPELEHKIPPYNDMNTKDPSKFIKTEPSRIDYVLVVKDYAMPIKALNAFVPFNLEKPWDSSLKYHSLSDHPGMYGYFEMKKPDKDVTLLEGEIDNREINTEKEYINAFKDYDETTESEN